MRTRWSLRAAFAATLVSLTSAGCNKDHGSPLEPPPGGNGPALFLLVSARVDSATLRSTGEFALQLVPSDSQGHVLLSDPWTVTARTAAPAPGPLAPRSQTVKGPSQSSTAAAVLLDYSSSMVRNDPNGSRIVAARLFWEEVLRNPGLSQVSLFAFGTGTASVGFTHSVLAQSWTRDTATLAAGLSRIRSGSGSYLYGSLGEISRWIGATIPGGSSARSIIVMTDGKAVDDSVKAAAFSAANQAKVRVHVVGLGPASDASAKTDPATVALMRELASRTGGIYAGAVTPGALAPIFQALAGSSTQGFIEVMFRLDTPPARGTRVAGTVTISGPRGDASAQWEFVAP